MAARRIRKRDDYRPISDYGLISNMHSCALVSKMGSVDWCCFPRFDSSSVFGRILDHRNGGHFQIAPQGVRSVTRRYLPDTNVLETTFESETGTATLTDFMPVYSHDEPISPIEIGPHLQVARILECVRGHIEFKMECKPRFEYGTIIPHAGLDSPYTGYVHGGADALSIYCSAPLVIVDEGYEATGTLRLKEKVYASVTYLPSFHHVEVPLTALAIEYQLNRTVRFWRDWAGLCTYQGEYRDDVVRSALTLKALTYTPTGSMVAAPTTSLPERIGGRRNWDYRFTWIRDASFALYALAILGYKVAAQGFKTWLEWTTMGRAEDLRVMYGLGGERRLSEIEIHELDGYRGSRPVRIGNGAYSQFQLDIYGEIIDSAHLYRKFIGEIDTRYWDFLRDVVDFVIDNWRKPDEGVWETRSERQQFVFSKVWCWVALDRAIKAVRELGLPGDIDRWRRVRAEIKAEVLEKGFNDKRGAFVQAYGSKDLDAANLILPLVGFIRADDPRMASTIRATERELTSPLGFVYRYRGYDDGLTGGEGTFNMCSFWLVDNLTLLGETEKAKALFDKLRSYSNDLGLFSEELDGETGQMLGNFPQAFSHMALINNAVRLGRLDSESGR